ncbi:hypothetical protein [Pseudorhodoplanes sp.]|uniref:hypothetical protein n=1 Tax=Pseudorhodoplanes sp. TaxID=1934341 RepID=UPI003D147B24
MSSLPESGQDPASGAAEPGNSDAADAGAPEIKVEPIGHAGQERLADDRAPVLFVPAERQRFGRAAVLAVAIALSAAIGSAVGAMAAVAFATPQPSIPSDAPTVEVNALRGVIAKLSAEVVALKASVDSNAKSASAQLAKIADRVERSEKAQAEPASRVAKLSELMERLERRSASTAAAPETTGSIAAKQQDRPPVVDGWMLREVFRGGAVVENERMGIFEVVPGANLPGLGRVETIRRQDGRWVVITPKGLIVSQR